MSSKRNIIVSLPLVWGVRNFIISGLREILEETFDIYYCIPETAKESLVRYGINAKNIVINQPVQKSFLQKRLDIILKKIHNSLHPTQSYKIFQEHILTSKNSGSFKLLTINTIDKILVFMCSNKPLFRLLTTIEGLLFDKRINSNFSSELKKLNAKYILSTSSVIESEWTILRTMRRLRVPIYAHVLSFDNITSRGYIPIDYFDKYFVWNTKMQKELIEFYSVDPHKITITGTPQFDYHVNSKYRLSEAETRLKLKVGQAPYVIYCANHFQLTPGEPDLFESIIDFFHEDKTLSQYKIILRLHPMDKYERWDDLLQKYDNVILNIAWEHRDDIPVSWGEPSLDEVVLYSNAIRYAAGVLNIASTVAVDAAIIGTASICIGYHPSNSIESSRYNSYHYSDHFQGISDNGSSPVAHTETELLDLIHDSIEHPEDLQEQRAALVDTYTDPATLGESTQTIGNILSHS
jgi:hypothetical protein